MKAFPHIATCVKMLLGMLFFFSAATKYVALDEFELYIYSFNLMNQGTAFVLARVILAGELLMGALLLSNRFHLLACLSNILLLLCFSGFLAYAALIGRGDNCNCFGELLPFTPVQSLIKNIVLLGLSLIAWKWAKANWRPRWWLALIMAVFPFETVIGMGYMGKISMIVMERNLMYILIGCTSGMGIISSLFLWPRSPFGQFIPSHQVWLKRWWLILILILTPFVGMAVASTAPEDWTGGDFKYPFDRELTKSLLQEDGLLYPAGTHDGPKVVAFYSLYCGHCKSTATKMQAVQDHNNIPDSCFVTVFMGDTDTCNNVVTDTSAINRFYEASGMNRHREIVMDPMLFATLTRGMFPLVMLVDGDSVHLTFSTAVPEKEILKFLNADNEKK